MTALAAPEVCAALAQCVAGSIPSAGARAKADIAQKAALAAQLQQHSRAAKVRRQLARRASASSRLYNAPALSDDEAASQIELQLWQ